MARVLSTSTSYSGRQLDLEVLQSMEFPSPSYVEVLPCLTASQPKMVSGIQKLVQRYAVLFPTILGTDVMQPDDGTELYGSILYGTAESTAEIEIDAKLANSIVRKRIQFDDDDESTYGPQPLDEKLDDCTIQKVVVDAQTRTVSVYVGIRSKAGSEVVFVIPTEAGIY